MRLRRPDWPERLADLIARRVQAPFRWGQNDCGLFVADAVHTMTNWDPAASLRGTYASRRTAQAALARWGGLAGFVEACAAQRNAQPIEPLAAQRGDVGLTRFDAQIAAGVIEGAALLVPGPAGLVRVPLDRVLRAWPV
jgi:hypothetical protein